MSIYQKSVSTLSSCETSSTKSLSVKSSCEISSTKSLSVFPSKIKILWHRLTFATPNQLIKNEKFDILQLQCHATHENLMNFATVLGFTTSIDDLATHNQSKTTRM